MKADDFVVTLKATPLDSELYEVYADWLEEHGEPFLALRHRNAAAWLRGEAIAEDERIAASSVILNLVGVDVLDVIKQLRRHNAGRRIRFLTVPDVLYCVVQAMKRAEGWHAVGGGNVANAYKYRAFQTVCMAAKRTNGSIRVGVAINNATKGASLTMKICGLSKKASPRDFRAWADAG